MTTEQRDKLTKEIDRSVLEMVDELNSGFHPRNGSHD